MKRRLAHGVAAVMGLAGVLALNAGAAVALCAPPATPAEAMAAAPIVFVGTVTALADRNETATFDVEEIWKGPNLSDPITVYGGATDPNVVVEDARTWVSGNRYLVFPFADTSGDLIDSLCSSTSVYTPAFDALRPATAHAPQGPPTSGPPGDPPIAAVFLVILLAGTAGAFLLFRSGRVERTG